MTSGSQPVSPRDVVPDRATIPADERRAQSVTDAMSRITGALGSFPAVLASVLLILVWAVCGPVFHFSDTWQLVINTGTTIITFNMVFIIQNTQNRDGRAMQVKLDAILGALDGVDNRLMGLEDLPESAIRRAQEVLHDCAEATDATGDPSPRPGADSHPKVPAHP